MTALFCDLVGFTAASEAADPEDVDRMLSAYSAMARAQIEGHGGVMEKFIGDAVVGVFGVPAAHEDDPERAVRAGLRIVEAAERLQGVGGAPLRLRVGVNTGEALVRLGVAAGLGGGFLTGDAINTASRIQSVAPEMGVAVGLATYEATAPVFDYEELEPATLKGKAEPVRVFHAKAPRARFGTDLTRTHDTPFVGREIDLALLKGIFDKTVAAGSVQLVTVVGEPGLGKSRIVAELGAYVDARPELVTWRQGRCLPVRGGDHVLGARRDPESAHAGILESDPPEAAQAKLERVLPEGPEREWFRQRLLPLLGIEASSSAEREELFTAWRRFLEQIAEERPTVLVFEDLHWADEAMLAFLEHLADLAEGVPLLLVGTARPELYERHPDYAAGLRNVNTDQPRAVVAGGDGPPRVGAAGGDRAAGRVAAADPRAGRRQPVVCGGVRPPAEGPRPARTGRFELGAESRRGGAVPGLGAGADRRPPRHPRAGREVAAGGCGGDRQGVLGRRRRGDGRARPANSDTAPCGSCRGRSWCGRPGSRRWPGEAEYAFWHILARDVAYNQLPRASRATRHVAAAAWIESKAPDRVEDLADVLAYHYATALELARAAGQARAGHQLEAPALRFLGLAGGARPRPGHGCRPGELRAGARAHPARAPGPGCRAGPLRRGRLPRRTPRRGGRRRLEEAIASFRAAGELPGAARAMGTLSHVLFRLGDPRWAELPAEAVALLEPLPPGPELVGALTELARCRRPCRDARGGRSLCRAGAHPGRAARPAPARPRPRLPRLSPQQPRRPRRPRRHAGGDHARHPGRTGPRGRPPAQQPRGSRSGRSKAPAQAWRFSGPGSLSRRPAGSPRLSTASFRPHGRRAR